MTIVVPTSSDDETRGEAPPVHGIDAVGPRRSRRTLAQLERDFKNRIGVPAISAAGNAHSALSVEPPRFTWYFEFADPVREEEYRREEVTTVFQKRTRIWCLAIAALNVAWAVVELGRKGGTNVGYLGLTACNVLLWLGAAACLAVARWRAFTLSFSERCFAATFALSSVAMILGLNGGSRLVMFEHSDVVAALLTDQGAVLMQFMAMLALIAIFTPVRPRLYALMVAFPLLGSIVNELSVHMAAAQSGARVHRSVGHMGAGCVETALEHERDLDIALSVANTYIFAFFVGVMIIVNAYLARFHRSMWHFYTQVEVAAANLRELARTEAVRESELRVAHAAADARSKLIRVVMHDLRSPLLSVESIAVGLRALPGHTAVAQLEVVQSLSALEACSALMQHVISDLLDFERIDSGRLVLLQTPFRAAQLVEMAVQAVVGTATAKGVAVRAAALPAELQARAFVGDLRRLQQCLVNGLSNAIKFTDPGGAVAVRASLRHLKAGSQADTEALVLEVVDQGVGISAPELDVLRKGDPFSQVGKGQLQGSGGTGLGLTIVRQLLALHGDACTLELESSGASAGTTFRLVLGLPEATGEDALAADLPLAQQLQARAHMAARERVSASDAVDSGPFGGGGGGGAGSFKHLTSKEAVAERSPGESHELGARPTRQPQPSSLLSFPPSFRVLHVEDDQMLRMMMGISLFGHLGVPFDVAADGLECLRVVLEERREYTLIVIDNQMPKLTGEKATRKLRKAGYKGVIIGMTGDPIGSPDRDDFEAAGLSLCLDKDPAGMQSLRDIICSFGLRDGAWKPLPTGPFSSGSYSITPGVSPEMPARSRSRKTTLDLADEHAA